VVDFLFSFFSNEIFFVTNESIPVASLIVSRGGSRGGSLLDTYSTYYVHTNMSGKNLHEHDRPD
jgi:hypothetical protein